MNIYSLVKADHRAVKALLMKLSQKSQNGSDAQKRKLLQKIRAELVVHNRAEETVFYSRLTESMESRVLAIEGKREHELVEELLSELSSLPGTSEEFIGKTKVLRDLVEHHVKEEEGEIHRQARKELSRAEAEEIGAEFTALKKSYAQDKEFLEQAHLTPHPDLQAGLLMQRGGPELRGACMKRFSVSFFFYASIVSLLTGVLILASMGDLQVATPIWVPTLFCDFYSLYGLAL